MKVSLFHYAMAALLAIGLCGQARAQSEEEVPLGDLARSLRKSKPPAPPAATVIDNDNLTQVMDQNDKHHLNGALQFSFDNKGKNFKIASPDGTCSLSFNANTTALVSDPYISQDLPPAELAKLDGPATIEGTTLQVQVHNASRWKVKEITVGLTILRPNATSASYGGARIVSAAMNSGGSSEKRSDMTVLYQLKGFSAPSTTTVFTEKIGMTIPAGSEWHWAIVQAKGSPEQ
ncbi:MAG: hypothetical protein JOY93_02530 [Acidobacteriales bacterium]|nr:hypothetical protein [Terriglobales bacterium]